MSRKVKKGDTVVVVVGKDRGAKGKVLKVFPGTQRVIVEGVNFVKKHTRRRTRAQPSGILEQESPVPVSNVMVVCPKCGAPTRVGKRMLESGLKVRICRKCEAQL